MKANSLFSLFCVVGLWSVAPNCFAQADSNVYNERVVVTSRYKPVVEESQKVNVAPVITDTVATMPKNLSYDITTRRLTSLYQPSRIKAARIIGEPATRLYSNYLKLGAGNYWSPLAEFYYNSLRSSDRTFGVRATHRSSWGTIGSHGDEEFSPNYYGQAPFSYTNVTGFGKLVTRNHLQLSAEVGYQNDFTRFYGFSDSTLHAVLAQPRDSIARSQYRMAYNTATAAVGVKTLNTDVNALGYEANVRATDLFATYGMNEFNINLDGNIHYGFTIAKQYKAIAYLHLTYDGYANSFNPSELPLGADSLMLAGLEKDAEGNSALRQSQYRRLYNVNPYIDFIFSGFQIHAGAVVALDGYNIPEIEPRVYPDATVSKSLFHDLVNVTLSARGNIETLSWNKLRLVNPYIAPGSDVRATSHYDFGANIRLNLSKKIDFNLYGVYSYLNDDLSFRLNERYTLHNVFTPVYDSLTRIKVGGSFVFINDEMLRLELKGNYYLYKNKQTQRVGDEYVERPLYYRPDFDAALAATVNYNDKIIGRVEFQTLGKMPYATVKDAAGADSTLTLPMRFGLNLEVEYRYNKALSFFLNFDNLLFQRYFYWQNYPSYRGLCLVGLTYTIPK